ncbi:MAG: preprotein translocase subunit SecA [Spirochaetales bacterium]|nr:preprotein translocase subunit SecA [Spirochaetales bacterium]
MADSVIKFLFGSKNDKDIKLMLPFLHKINENESWAMGLSAEDFKAQTKTFKEKIKQGETLESILPQAFALAREAARRILGERPYDVQLMGALALHNGNIMEMKTGEGKTLSSVPAAYLNALTGEGVHVVTVNDYLAGRDAKWMEPVFEYLGLTVGAILPDMDTEARKIAYSKDITYGTNNELGFDYLRDNMSGDIEQKVQRGHNYCIVDEIDSILIDEARTPLIISGQADDDTEKFIISNMLCQSLVECEKDPKTGDYPEEGLVGDYKISEKNKNISFSEQGMTKIEELLLRGKVIKGSIYDEENFDYIHYFTKALTARLLFAKDVDYVVQEGKIEIVDQFTGRILHGRRYSDGLHQAIEAKEGIKVARRNKTLATITLQNFFRMYTKISGMTGTADTEAKEFTKIYDLDVIVIPTNRPVARIDDNDTIFINEEFKFKAICDEITRVYKKGQPILVGTVSIEKSELLSSMLRKRGVRHEVLNAKNHQREAMIIAEAGAKSSVTIATNMAGRGTDIKLGGNPEFRARKKAGTKATEEEYKNVLEEEYKKWRADYEEVKSLGGLYILGSERHDSRRIDNQLRGRAGRQGDPGESKFFLSLDDDLMRLFGGERLKNIMKRLGLEGDEPIHHKMINNSIERAQTKVEDRNFEIRKHLLEYDNVLNEQRNFIYSQRDNILKDNNLKERIINTAIEITEDLIDDALKLNEKDQIMLNFFLANFHDNFFIKLEDLAENLRIDNEADIIEKVKKIFEEKIQENEKLIGTEVFNQIVKIEYLKNIDKKWQDHLEMIEELREAVRLRAYGQKDPLLEYKKEGFQIFDNLLYSIKTDISKKIMRVKIQVNDEPRRLRTNIMSAQEKHATMGQFGALRQGSPAPGQDKVQVRRTMPKVGRNEPCPCGSGKKYKQCHGA